MLDIHEGNCSVHIEGMMLVGNILMIAFYWSTMPNDAIFYVKRCEKC